MQRVMMPTIPIEESGAVSTEIESIKCLALWTTRPVVGMSQVDKSEDIHEYVEQGEPAFQLWDKVILSISRKSHHPERSWCISAFTIRSGDIYASEITKTSTSDVLMMRSSTGQNTLSPDFIRQHVRVNKARLPTGWVWIKTVILSNNQQQCGTISNLICCREPFALSLSIRKRHKTRGGCFFRIIIFWNHVPELNINLHFQIHQLTSEKSCQQGPISIPKEIEILGTEMFTDLENLLCRLAVFS